MKQANIQITFEEEKLRALRRYIAKRNSTLESELQKAAQRLYEKVVPAAVQEYISDCAQEDFERSRRRNRRCRDEQPGNRPPARRALVQGAESPSKK